MATTLCSSAFEDSSTSTIIKRPSFFGFYLDVKKYIRKKREKKKRLDLD